MKRFHDKDSLRKRNKRREDAIKATPKWQRDDPECWAYQQNWNKRHPHDCGNPRCPICRNPRYRDQPRTKRHPIQDD